MPPPVPGDAVQTVRSVTDRIAKLKRLILSVYGLALAVLALLVLVVADIKHLDYLKKPLEGLLAVLTVLALLHIKSVPVEARILLSLVPGVKDVLDVQERINRNASIVSKMSLALGYYKMWPFAPHEEAELATSLPSAEADEDRLKNCSEKVVEKIAKSDISRELILLLYDERTAARTLLSWSESKAQLAPSLARVLLESRRLQIGHFCGQVDVPDLQQVLVRMEEFSLEAVQAELYALCMVWHLTLDYCKFLESNEIATEVDRVQLATILDLTAVSRQKLGSKEDLQLDVLVSFGNKLFDRSLPPGHSDVATCFCLLSLAIFLTGREELDLRRRVCIRLGGEASAPFVVLAYLEFSEDLKSGILLAGKSVVTLKFLIFNWHDKIKETKNKLKRGLHGEDRKRSGFESEVDDLKRDLQEGQWPRGLPWHLGATFRSAYEQSIPSGPLRELLHEDSLVKRLRKIFERVTPATVERYLQTKTINAYLITFASPDDGTVSGLLDLLVSLKKESVLEDLPMELYWKGQRKYNFQIYTNNVRIGVAPKGWTFEDFHREFQTDFAKVVKARHKLLPQEFKAKDLSDIELILNQFGLSGGNYQPFVYPNLTRERAIERVKELFKETLDADDLLTMIEYQGNVPLMRILADETPLVEMLGGRVKLNGDEKESLQENDRILRDAILGVVPISGVQRPNAVAVGRQFASASEDQKKDITMKAAKKLRGLARLGERRSFEVVEGYLQTISTLATIVSLRR